MEKLDIFAIKYSDRTLDSLDLVLSLLIANPDTSDDLLKPLITLVSKEECEGFYYIIMSFIERLNTLKTATHKLKVGLSEFSFMQYLNSNINTFLRHPEVNARKMFEDIQVTMLEDNTAETKIKEQRLLFSICMKKFKVLSSNKIELHDSVALLDNLYQKCLEDYCINSVRLESILLNQGLTYKGKTYEGVQGYIELTALVRAKILKKQGIWEGINDSVIILDSVEAYNKIMERNKFRMLPICKFGFKPIDLYATLTTADIVNLTATEGTGKTTYCCNLATHELLAGFSVIYMCGETVESVIVNMILSHFIYVKTGYEISWKECAFIYNQLTQDMLDNAGDGDKLEDFENMPEEYYAIVNDCKYDLYTNPQYGKLIPIKAFTYNNFKQEVFNILDSAPELKFGHIFIDHTDGLVIDNTSGNLYIKDRHQGVGELFKQIIEVKRERGVPTFTTSHTSFDTEKKIQAGQETGTRVGATNSGTSKDVDIVITFEATQKLKQQGLIKVVVKKYRTTDDTLFVPFIVKKDFTACNFIYTPELQSILGSVNDKGVDTTEVGIKSMKAEDLIG